MQGLLQAIRSGQGGPAPAYDAPSPGTLEGGYLDYSGAMPAMPGTMMGLPQQYAGLLQGNEWATPTPPAAPAPPPAPNDGAVGDLQEQLAKLQEQYQGLLNQQNQGSPGIDDVYLTGLAPDGSYYNFSGVGPGGW